MNNDATTPATRPSGEQLIDVTDVSLDMTSNLDDELVRLEIEAALERLDGVDAVRLVPGTTRPVDELHAVVQPDREPKRVARDLQTLMLARFGVDVDRRVISVVRLGPDVVARLTETMPRLTLDSVNVTVRASDTAAAVEVIDANGGSAIGCAGPIAGDAVIEATAHATVDALNSYLHDGAARVLDARIVDAGPHRTAVVLVEVHVDHAVRVLTGSALVRRAEADAVARAVLDATNRLNRA